MKRLALLLVFIISISCVSGCNRISLDTRTEEAYVEYAVNAIINHDKNNMLKLERVDVEMETEKQWISDSTEASTEASSDGDSNPDGTDNDTNIIDSDITYVDLQEALGNDALSVKLNNIKECTSYPEETDDFAFVMTASEGSRLVVLEMSITNVSGDAVKLDTIDNFSFKGAFNGVVKTNARTTILDYALNDNVHNITSGQTKDVVLIYELNNERITSIDKIVVSVVRDGVTYNVNVK